MNSRAGKFTTTTAILLLLVAIGSSVSIIRAQSTNSIESERGTYATFQDAIDDAQNGDVLTLVPQVKGG